MRDKPETYAQQQAAKLKRRTIHCLQCSTLGKPVFHGWKRAEGIEFKPDAEESHDKES